MSTMLSSLSTIEVVLATTNPLAALAFEDLERADVALIDLALGRDTLTGMDLGLALRNRNPDIGIVIHSQHPLKKIERQLPAGQRIGWSFLAKTGTLSAEELGDILRSTASGMSHRMLLNADSVTADDAEQQVDALAGLSPRQRVIMGLASLGMSSPEIGEHLDISSDSVRKDLSKAYRTLVPPNDAGADVRTKAILTYLELVQSADRSEI